MTTRAAPEKSKPVAFGVVPGGAGPNGGTLVQRSPRFSPAGKAGILAGDEIMTLNGTQPASIDEANTLLQAIGVGGIVKVLVVRGGKRVEIPVTLGENKIANLDLGDIDQILERNIAPAA
jgi:S1-C subfamily serine protease